jgi:hypothetical protein
LEAADGAGCAYGQQNQPNIHRKTKNRRQPSLLQGEKVRMRGSKNKFPVFRIEGEGTNAKRTILNHLTPSLSSKEEGEIVFRWLRSRPTEPAEHSPANEKPPPAIPSPRGEGQDVRMRGSKTLNW